MIISRNRLIEILFSLFFLLLIIFNNDLDFAVITYLSSLFIISYFLFKIKRVNVFSIYSLAFIFFNLYVVIPILNYLFFNVPIFLSPIEKHYSDIHFTYFLHFIKNSNIGILLYSVISWEISNQKSTNSFKLNHKVAFVFFIIGYILLIIQLLITKSYNYIGNGGFFRQHFFSFPPLYFYLTLPTLFLLGKSIANREISKLRLLIYLPLIFLYIFQWLIFGIRNIALYTLLVFLIGLFIDKRIKIKISFKWLLLVVIVFFVFIFYSIRTRMRTESKPTITEVVEFGLKNPIFINPGALEYGTSYYNYAIMKRYNFEEDYFFEHYLLLNFSVFYRILGINNQTLFYRYRDNYFPEYKQKAGSSGGSGWSIQYEFEMVFGKYFYWVMYLFLGTVFWIISLKSNKSGIWALFMVFLIPSIIMFARSPLVLLNFITKFLYAYLFYHFFIFIDKTFFIKK